MTSKNHNALVTTMVMCRGHGEELSPGFCLTSMALVEHFNNVGSSSDDSESSFIGQYGPSTGVPHLAHLAQFQRGLEQESCLQDPFLNNKSLQCTQLHISSPVKTSDNFEKFADKLAPLNSLPPDNDDSTLKKDLHFQVYSNSLFEFDDNFKSSTINP
ncbi:hypothetical protein Tco_1515355 [Tanacetum coccineum]